MSIILGAEVRLNVYRIMGIFDFFKPKTDNVKLGHIKSLLALAAADGRIQKNELELIAKVCQREGIPVSELEKCIKDPQSIEFEIPNDSDKQVQYLKDMVCVMMVDGDIDDKEVGICKSIAVIMGFRHEVIDAMILDIIVELKNKLES